MHACVSYQRLVQLTSCPHSVQRFDALVHSILSSGPVLLLQLLVFIAAFGNIIVNPVECIRHVVVALRQARSIADGVGDNSAIRLDEIDLDDESATAVNWFRERPYCLPWSDSSSCRSLSQYELTGEADL